MRKKILILSHTYGLPFIESCNQYTQLFDKSQYEVTVAYLVDPPDEEVKRKTAAEHVLFLNISRRAIRGLKLSAIWKMLKLCRENNFSMVICQRYKPSYLMLWVAQFCRIPKLIFILHAIGTMRAIPRKLLIAGLMRKNMVFAGVSDAVRDDLRHDLWNIPHERIITLHNILDYHLFEPKLLSREQARRELNLPENIFVFGNVGRYVDKKDQSTLIRAYAQFKQQHANIRLIIIGSGQLENELKELTKQLGIDNDVIITGFVKDSFRLMKAFDVLAHCAIEEAFGRVLLEAMLARIPIIATRADGIPEVIGDAGFLVEPAQPEQLAQTMTHVFQLPQNELSRIGEAGYQRMINRFSLDAFKKVFWQPPIINAETTS